MKAEDLVISDRNGNLVEDQMRSSSDLATHLVLYRAFPSIRGMVHTDSEYAKAWRAIPCLGTTHADYSHAPVRVTNVLDKAEIASEYEANARHSIVRAFHQWDYETVPVLLVANHGPFTWGPNAAAAAHTAFMLE